MRQQPFFVVLANIPLSIHPLFSETQACFGPFCTSSYNTIASLQIDLSELQKAKSFFPEASDASLEYNLLLSKASAALLPFRRCVFHGVAFIWRNKAYIFTAPSGTGKTTQYRQWLKLYCPELRIINGDKSILECRPNGTILVHSSPWAGKERWGSMESAPLGGIVYLHQSQENSITRLSPQQAAAPLFRQFLFSADNAELVRQVCAIEEQMLRAAPVWMLANRGDLDSARLCHDTLLQFEEGRP